MCFKDQCAFQYFQIRVVASQLLGWGDGCFGGRVLLSFSLVIGSAGVVLIDGFQCEGWSVYDLDHGGQMI